MTLPSERRAFFAALARLGAMVALPFVLVRSAKALDVGPGEQPIDEGAASELAALRQELDALKVEVKRMNDEKGTIKAPFKVVNDANERIFEVGLNSNGDLRSVTGKKGGAVVVIGINDLGGPSVNLVDSGGKTRASLRGSDAGGQLLIDADDVNVRLGSGGGGGGFISSSPGLIISKDKSSYLEMAVKDAGGTITTFDPTGKPIVAIGASKETPLAINDSAGNAFFSAGIEADGMGRLTVGNKDKDHTAIGIAQGAAFMSLYGPSGNSRVELNASDDFGVRLWDADKNAYFVVNNPKEPTVSIGASEKAQVILGVRKSSEGSVILLTDNDGKTRTALHSNPKTSLQLHDAAGIEQFAVGELDASSSMRLQLGDPAKQHVYLGMTDGPDQATLQLSDTGGKLRAELSSADKNAFRLTDVNDREYFSVGDPKVPTAWIGYDDEAHVRLGVLPSGEGATMIMFDKGGTSRGHIIATEKSTTMNLNDKDMRVDLGRDITTEGFAGLILGKDAKDYARLHMSAEKGGSIRFANPDGKYVALVGHYEGLGGNIALTGPAGGKPVVRITGTPEGGEMSLAEKGGATLVSLLAGEKGQIYVTGGDSKGTVFLEATDRATVKITNAAEQIVVNAFENTDGLGVVSCGPKESGVAALLGNQGVAASAILGKG